MRMTMGFASLFLGLMFMLAAAPALGGEARKATGRVKDPEVWMCHKNPLELLERPADWAFVRRHVSGIKMYIGLLKDTPDDQLAALAKMLKANRIPVAFECGGTLGFARMDDRNGEDSARRELARFRRFIKAGGRIDYLDLDGPVRRLLYARRKDGKRFTSAAKAADQLMIYLARVERAIPKVQFFLLTNFPNWGYRDVVSYHARGPKRQDWGDYDKIVRTVLAKAKATGRKFAGVTVDNPYEYAIGEHFSVKLKDPKKVDWIQRIRDYEDFAKLRGLEFNFIANSEQGGKTSGVAFAERTLKMVDAYVKAGGKPTRYVIQSWYPHPVKVLPETEPDTMTGLVKAVILKLHPELAPQR